MMNENKMMNKIKEARLSAELTQQSMADLLEMSSKRNIENWEGGKSYPPHWVEKLILEKLNDMKKAPTVK